MKKIKYLYDKNTKPNNAGFSLVELLIVVVILGILSAISVLYLFSARRAANTTSALSAMRTIHQSQASYSSGVGNGTFGNEDELFVEEYIDSAVAAACNPLPTSTSKGGLAPPAPKPKSGYVFTILPDNQPGLQNGYTATSKPLVTTGANLSGDKTFFIDQTGVLRASSTATDDADLNSAPIN